MAKAKVNKSALIREALAAHPEKSPMEISEVLKEQGLKVPPQYVSTIKSSAKARKRKKLGKRKKVAAGNGIDNVAAALSFIKTAGGIEQAKATLGTIEQIGKAL